MAERLYEVTERLTVYNVFEVRARTRREAVEKVLDGEYEFVHSGQGVFPAARLTERSARLVRERAR